MTGKKNDVGKLPADIPIEQFPNAIEALAAVANYGHEKYELDIDDWDNWKSVPDALFRYKQAKMRHYLAMKKGEKIDPESGLPHIFHYTWNVMAITELEIIEELSKIRTNEKVESNMLYEK